jgi:polyisoprenoid-binding protein YceI
MNPIRSLALPTLIAMAGMAGAADQYDVDGVHSTVLFKIDHFGVSNFIGRFDKISGAISWDAADPGKSTIAYTIQADSVDTNFEKRDQHLKSADFFDTKQFPTLEFKSKSVKKGAENEFSVEGELTIHGVTKPITLTVKKTGEGKDPSGAQRIGFYTTFPIKRSDFGMNFMPGALGDAVEVTVSSEGVKK